MLVVLYPSNMIPYVSEAREVKNIGKDDRCILLLFQSFSTLFSSLVFW